MAIQRKMTNMDDTTLESFTSSLAKTLIFLGLLKIRHGW